MSYRECKVEIVRVHWDCEVPGCDGEMLPTGLVYPMVDPLRVHACSKCGRNDTSTRRYPSIEYRDVAA